MVVGNLRKRKIINDSWRKLPSETMQKEESTSREDVAAEEEYEETSDTCQLLNGGELEIEVPDTKESLWATSVQMFIPFILAGFGMVAASLLLDKVQHWQVYQEVSEVYILVPALLGLKGNLEMTLASRLSTHANIGHFDNPKMKLNLIIGNLSLILCQATVVGFLASIAAVLLAWMPKGGIDVEHVLLLCASSVVTALGASFILGLVMIGVVLFSKSLNINPDNVATPIAASLGDLTTLACLSLLASFYLKTLEKDIWFCTVSIIIALVMIPVWAWMASREKYSQQVLCTGWTPVISAMIISSVGGLILDYTVAKYKGVAVFQLIINGVGGNLVAVQASRISTELHMKAKLGHVPNSMTICLKPCAVFCDTKETSHASTAQMLLLMVIPGHLIFSYTISYLQAGHTSFTFIFLLVYLTAAMIQVVLLLYIAQVMILAMWKVSIDPDNSAIPYLTALGDLLGTLLLSLAFEFLFLIGDHDSDVGD
ncbi:solute carrier family 41 member 1-like [Coccinella septempunctata]|uniref:solute carrier family 41 member 1-like n=1 Tax=Coccinella septempunctata TaxID=41139 RepID=UPI001D08E632|nr:solute carrier family 41 member 1-like [Coccinella septempunctata]XP_044765347.1 solute carrier family 41 member 1-like [Coccinella septempunctata]